MDHYHVSRYSSSFRPAARAAGTGACFLARLGFDTTKNGPSKTLPKLKFCKTCISTKFSSALNLAAVLWCFTRTKAAVLRVKDAGDRRTRRGPRRATSEPHPTGPLPNLVQMKIASLSLLTLLTGSFPRWHIRAQKSKTEW